MYRRKPQPRAPSNHTALVSLPNVNDIVTPALGVGAHSNSSISKRKFLNLYSSTVKKTRVRVSSKRPQGDGATDSGGNGNSVSGDGLQDSDEEPLHKTLAVDQGTDETSLEQSSEEWSMPTDTKIALELMCSQFPKLEKANVRPFVLRSQLYSSVSDRTLVDRELEGLKLQHAVRLFKINTGQDDYAVMFMADYLAQIESGKKRLASKRSEDEMAVFDWFTKHVIPSHVDAGITHEKLVSLLSEGGEVKDSHISLLMNAGFLTRQLVDSTAYWFAIPNVGFLLKSVTNGRKEILSFLARRKYREILQVPLERRKLQYSVLGIRFHIRDLLGLGHIHVIPSPSGPLVRLTRD